eukprot:TRINITY_DN1012_c0_g1_i1.p2 TRINITY_DN1012_c0_g1~~TRINITY_DN1012_c0_g1_i1.p2  ORF type:complete len:211 (-),score=67.49 TRINITY_DN1012_c0_g1_i1:113-745(-)
MYSTFSSSERSLYADGSNLEMYFTYGIVPEANPLDKVPFPSLHIFDVHLLEPRRQSVLMWLGYSSPQNIPVKHLKESFDTACKIFSMPADTFEGCYYELLEATETRNFAKVLEEKCPSPPSCDLSLKEYLLPDYKNRKDSALKVIPKVQEYLEKLKQKKEVTSYRIKLITTLERYFVKAVETYEKAVQVTEEYPWPSEPKFGKDARKDEF